jgi:hypothetical protein
MQQISRSKHAEAMAMVFAASSEYIFRQLVDSTSSTYTYVLADAQTKEAVLIDPVLEQVRQLQEHAFVFLHVFYCTRCSSSDRQSQAAILLCHGSI